jgi:glycogen operon protein
VRLSWHGVRLDEPDWSEHSHSLAATLRTLNGSFVFHMMFNAYWEPLTFELPLAGARPSQAWRRCIDTALASPDDICPWPDAPVVAQSTYGAQPRSVVLLAQRLDG